VGRFAPVFDICFRGDERRPLPRRAREREMSIAVMSDTGAAGQFAGRVHFFHRAVTGRLAAVARGQRKALMQTFAADGERALKHFGISRAQANAVAAARSGAGHLLSQSILIAFEE
jgi:hypothetical protein